MPVHSFHSERHGGLLHTGKKDARPPEAGSVHYRDLRKAIVKAGIALPPVPTSFTDHSLDFAAGAQPGGFGMHGNGPQDDVNPAQLFPSSDAAAGGAGDCTIAEKANAFRQSAKDVGAPVPTFGTRSCITGYTGETAAENSGQGYDPVSGNNDDGCDMQSVNTRMQTVGLLDDDGVTHKIGQTCVGTPGDFSQMWEMVYLFGSADIGVQLQQAQEDAFNVPGQVTWDYVKGSPVVGGHCILVSYLLRLISWAEDVVFTEPFITNQCDEIYAVFDPARLEAVTGLSPEGFDQADLEQWIVAIAQAKAAA